MGGGDSSSTSDWGTNQIRNSVTKSLVDYYKVKPEDLIGLDNQDLLDLERKFKDNDKAKQQHKIMNIFTKYVSN